MASDHPAMQAYRQREQPISDRKRVEYQPAPDRAPVANGLAIIACQPSASHTGVCTESRPNLYNGASISP